MIGFLTVLPLSFDYGLSQLTTAFYAGATNVLMNYLLPRDIIQHYQRTTDHWPVAAVPPLWIQLAQLDWGKVSSLRYITSSGGAMPRMALERLRKALPVTQIFLMYGFTEAFRSTCLAPEELNHRRPNSIGKAIPNVEVLVLREDGSHCVPGEPGELVHRGVSWSRWAIGMICRKNSDACFKPVKSRVSLAYRLRKLPLGRVIPCSMDEEGFLYFIERRDAMIKTSGYRVSPTEVEEVICAAECRRRSHCHRCSTSSAWGRRLW